MRPHPPELKEAVLRRVMDEGESARAVGLELGVSGGTISRWTADERVAGRADHRPSPKASTARTRKELLRRVLDNGEVCTKVARELGVSQGGASLWGQR